MTVGPVGADTGRGAGRVCCNRSRLPRPADGGSMMPLAAALRTPGADLVRCDAEGMAGHDHPLDEHRRAVCEPGAGRGVPQREDLRCWSMIGSARKAPPCT